MNARIIDRGRGPEIEGTRVTVYRIMDFLAEGAAAERMAAELSLSREEVDAALDYIKAHETEVTGEYEAILRRVQRANPPDIASRRAPSIEELKRRIATRYAEANA